MQTIKRVPLFIFAILTSSCASTQQQPVFHQNSANAFEIEDQLVAVLGDSSSQNSDFLETVFWDSISTLRFTVPEDIGFIQLSKKINSSLVFDKRLKRSIQSNADFQVKISFLEFQFHYLNAAQTRLYQKYYNLGNDDRLQNMLKFTVDNNEYGLLKGELLLQVLYFASAETAQNKHRCWQAIEKMLASIDWRNSEKGNKKIQRSPLGARVPRKAITAFLDKQKKISANDKYVIAVIKRIRKQKTKYKPVEPEQLYLTSPKIDTEYERFIAQLTGLFREAAESSDLQKKLELYSQIIALDPQNATAHFNRAVCYLSSHNPESALRDLSITARIDPAFQQLHYYWGVALMQQQKYESAIPEFNAAIASSVSDHAYFKRAMCHLNLQNYAAAVDDFTHAIGVDSSNVTYVQNRALCLIKLKEYPRASKDFQWIITREPENTSAWYNFGLCHWKLRQWQQAADAWEKCLSIDPKYENARHSLPRAKKYARIAASRK
ncbi:MAG: tetratricopeptide repeat protein [Calditrichaeota bacterium]|nr:MAG: tetratricopeptide repeat protein [Calditrichota bacterium]